MQISHMPVPSIIAIIPARMASTRLPGKPLMDIAGKPMVQWVYERANNASHVSRAIVATPDKEIANAVEKFGGEAILTSAEHQSGTDRVAEVACKMFRDEDVIINVQADEPLIPSEAIDALVPPLLRPVAPEMTTLMRRITREEAENPSLVKVVVDRLGHALYFSRSPIPYVRNEHEELAIFGHIGIYGYHVRSLRAFERLDQTPLELTESLEQLRALENGWRVHVTETHFSPIGVDTEEDLRRVRAILADMG